MVKVVLRRQFEVELDPHCWQQCCSTSILELPQIRYWLSVPRHSYDLRLNSINSQGVEAPKHKTTAYKFSLFFLSLFHASVAPVIIPSEKPEVTGGPVGVFYCLACDTRQQLVWAWS